MSTGRPLLVQPALVCWHHYVLSSSWHAAYLIVLGALRAPQDNIPCHNLAPSASGCACLAVSDFVHADPVWQDPGPPPRCCTCNQHTSGTRQAYSNNCSAALSVMHMYVAGGATTLLGRDAAGAAAAALSAALLSAAAGRGAGITSLGGRPAAAPATAPARTTPTTNTPPAVSGAASSGALNRPAGRACLMPHMLWQSWLSYCYHVSDWCTRRCAAAMDSIVQPIDCLLLSTLVTVYLGHCSCDLHAAKLTHKVSSSCKDMFDL